MADLLEIKDRVSDKLLGHYGIHSVGISRKRHAVMLGVSHQLDDSSVEKIRNCVQDDLDGAELLIDVEGQARQQ